MCFSLLKSHRNGYLSFASFSEFLANQSEDNSKCLFSTFAYRAYGTLRRTTTSCCASGVPRRSRRKEGRRPSVRGNVRGGRGKRRRRVPQRRNGISERRLRGFGRSFVAGSFASDMSWRPVSFVSCKSWRPARWTRTSPWSLETRESGWRGCRRPSAIASIACENDAPRRDERRPNGENAPRSAGGRSRRRTALARNARGLRPRGALQPCKRMPCTGRVPPLRTRRPSSTGTALSPRTPYQRFGVEPEVGVGAPIVMRCCGRGRTSGRPCAVATAPQRRSTYSRFRRRAQTGGSSMTF